MKDDTVVALRQPESFSDDPLTEILRVGLNRPQFAGGSKVSMDGAYGKK